MCHLSNGQATCRGKTPALAALGDRLWHEIPRFVRRAGVGDVFLLLEADPERVPEVIIELEVYVSDVVRLAPSYYKELVDSLALCDIESG